MPTGVSFSAAHRLAVLPMCQPLICHRALVTMSQSLDGAPSRLCRKPGEICSIRTTGMPSRGSSLTPFSFCPPIRPHLPVTSPVPAPPFRGGKRGAAPKNPFLCKVLPSRQFHPATPKPSAFIKTFFEKKASKSLPGRKKVIPLQPQTRSNGVVRPALRSEEEVIEKFTYQAASVRIQRKTNRQGLVEEKDRRIKRQRRV